MMRPVENLCVLLIRFKIFHYLASESFFNSLLCYFVVCNLVMIVMRYIDCFQHTFDVIEVDLKKIRGMDTELHKRDTDKYEQSNTYSNIFAFKYRH